MAIVIVGCLFAAAMVVVVGGTAFAELLVFCVFMNLCHRISFISVLLYYSHCITAVLHCITAVFLLLLYDYCYCVVLTFTAVLHCITAVLIL